MDSGLAARCRSLAEQISIIFPPKACGSVPEGPVHAVVPYEFMRACGRYSIAGRPVEVPSKIETKTPLHRGRGGDCFFFVLPHRPGVLDIVPLPAVSVKSFLLPVWHQFSFAPQPLAASTYTTCLFLRLALPSSQSRLFEFNALPAAFRRSRPLSLSPLPRPSLHCHDRSPRIFPVNNEKEEPSAPAKFFPLAALIFYLVTAV